MSVFDGGFGSAAVDDSRDDDDQLQPEDTLIDRGVDDVLDEGYSPPERPYGRDAYGSSETMDQLLAEEEPDPASRLNVVLDDDELQRSDESERETEFPEWREVGRGRAGRLVARGGGVSDDDESDVIAEDVGISGGAASAEEAAMHIIDDGD